MIVIHAAVIAGSMVVGPAWGSGCPADLSGNGAVDVPDLVSLLAVWGLDPGGLPDFDGDGAVAVPDLLLLLAPWGPCPFRGACCDAGQLGPMQSSTPSHHVSSRVAG